MFEFLKRLFGRGQTGGGDFSMAPQDRVAAQSLSQAGLQVKQDESRPAKPRRAARHEYDRDPPPEKPQKPSPQLPGAALPGLLPPVDPAG